MPIKPEGSPLTIVTSTSTAYLAVDEFTYTRTTIPFQRAEFLSERLRTVKNADGSMPIYYTLSGGRVRQFSDSCNSSNNTTRPLGPDDSNVDSIYWRFDVLRFTIVGGANDQAQVDILGAQAKSHQILLAEFAAHQEIARSADVSFTFLTNMQSETFSYLTGTPVTMSGFCAGSFSGTSNLLITDFATSVEYENPIYAAGASTSSEVLSSFKLDMEVRVLQAARSSTF